MAFRIGRKYAQHTYPEPRRSGGVTPDEFARNFAVGPATDTDITTTTPLPWSDVDVGAPGNSVTITPESTGVVRVLAVMTFKNPSGADTVDAVVQILLDGVAQAFPNNETFTVPINGGLVVPMLVELDGLNVGQAYAIGIQVSTSDSATLRIVQESSSIEVQEVEESTG